MFPFLTNRPALVCCATLLAVCLAPLRAEVTMPAIFSDHMVLQRDRPIAVWGNAAPGETVRVQFAGHAAEATASADGTWRVSLPALAANKEGRALEITGSNQLVFTNVLVGDLWLCSGQSNMEKPFGPRKGQKPVENSEKELAAAAVSSLRLYQVPHYGVAKPGSAGLRWLECAPDALKESQFSAVAYYFGRELVRSVDVPIGLIHASFGGTHIEAWMPKGAFATRPSLADLPTKPYHAWVEGVQASNLYDSMLVPLVPFAVRGFLWYQGEANCMDGDGAIYTEKMEAMVEAWRTAWQSPQAPFYYVQLAPFNYSDWKSFPKWLTPEALPVFWEAQARAQRIQNSGMIVTTDLAGNARDIHPTNKRDVGLRLAHLALRDAYGLPGPEARSPEFAGMRHVADGRIELTFRHVGRKLRTRDGRNPTHFRVAGADQVFKPASARLAGDKIVVWSKEVTKPVAVRFAWHETAVSNVVNSSDLPMAPFRTDDWPVKTTRDRP